MVLVPRIQVVSMPLNVTGFTPFPDVRNLTGPNVRVLGAVAYTVAQMTNVVGGGAVVSAADSIKLAVTLQEGSDQRLQNVPYSDLIRANNAGLYYPLQEFAMDLTKSGILNLGSALTANTNAVVAFFYRVIDKDAPVQ